MVETFIRRIWSRYQVYNRIEKIAADAISRLPNKGNQKTTHESTYTMETMSEIYDVKELTNGTFPISF